MRTIKALLLVSLLLLPFTVFSQDDPPLPLDDHEALSAFFDAQMTRLLDEYGLAGGAIAVVHGDEVVFKSGYGLADIESDTPVDPDVTQFGLASVTKTVTATAIMQLVEDGQIDLDADVNTYLPADLQIANTLPEPITVRHLLTHTGGFDETPLYAYMSAEALEPGTVFLTEQQPARLHQPGEVLSYSNYSFELLGQIITEVTGMPYEDYLQANLFDPLGMDSTALAQSVANSPNLATRYNAAGGDRPNTPAFQIYIPGGAAGAMVSTVDDMSAYLIAHLNEGAFGDVQMLQSETVELMHAPAFSRTDGDGWALGFIDARYGDLRTLNHGGDLPGVMATLFMVPEANVGYVALFNTSANIFAGDAREDLAETFVNTYFQEGVAETVDIATTEGVNLEPYTGVYSTTRHIHEGEGRSIGFQSALLQVVVTAQEDNTLRLEYPLGMLPPATFAPVGDGVFADLEDSSNRIAFYAEPNSGDDMLYGTVIMPMTMERVPWYGVAPILIGVLIAAASIPLVYLLSSLVAGIWRLIRRTRREPSAARRWTGWTALLVALLMTVLAALWTVNNALTGIMVDGRMIVPLIALQTLTALVALGGLVLLYSTIVVWREGVGPVVGRVWYTLLPIAALLMTWQMIYWNVLPIL